MPDWSNIESIQRWLDVLERKEREKLTALKLWRQGERTAAETTSRQRKSILDSPYGDQALAESKRRQEEAQRRAQDALYAEQIREKHRQQIASALGAYRQGEREDYVKGNAPTSPLQRIEIPSLQVSSSVIGSSGLGGAAPIQVSPVSGTLTTTTTENQWRSENQWRPPMTWDRMQAVDSSGDSQRELASMGIGSLIDKWFTDAVDWWKNSAAGQAAAQRWQAIVDPNKSPDYVDASKLPSFFTSEGRQQYAQMVQQAGTTSSALINWMKEQAKNPEQPEWFRAVADGSSRWLEAMPEPMRGLMLPEWLPGAMPILGALWSKGADKADDTQIGKSMLMAGGAVMTALQAGDDTLKIAPMPGKSEFTIGQFLSSLGRAIWENPWLLVVNGRPLHDQVKKWMHAYQDASGGKQVIENGGPAQWALLNVYGSPETVKRTYDDLMLYQNRAGVIADLETRAAEAQARGDMLMAAELGAQAQWWRNARPVDVVDKHTEILPELVFTMLFDWTNLIGAGFDLAKLGTSTRRMTQAMKQAMQSEDSVLRALDEAVATSKALMTANGGSLLAAKKVNPIREFVGLTNEARAQIDAANLFTFFTQLLGDVRNTDDARLLVTTATNQPQMLIKGIEGLSEMGRLLQPDGKYKVGAGLFSSRVLDAVPVLLEAKDTLMNLPSLNAERFNVVNALAEIHDALFASAYRVYGLADWATPRGTKGVRVAAKEGAAATLEYLDEQGNVISRSRTMPLAQAEGEANRLNRWIAEMRTEAPELTVLRMPDRLIRSFMSSVFLNLMPGHWVRNAVSGVGHLMTDGVMTFEPTSKLVGEIAAQFGGSLPISWMREGFQATAENATAAAKAMGAPNQGSFWDFLGKGNLLSRMDAAGSRVWTGGTSAFGGHLPIGELNMRLRGFAVPFRRALREEWGRVVRQRLRPLLQGLGLTEEQVQGLLAAVIDAAVVGNKREIVPAIQRVLDGTASAVDMQALGLTNGSISPSAYRTIRNALDMYVTTGDRVAAERAINEALDSEQMLFAKILADAPAQPGRQTFTQLENVQDYAELLRDAEHAAKKAGISIEDATAPIKQLIEQYGLAEQKGYQALMAAAAEQPSPQVRSLLLDTWAQVYDAKIFARLQQGDLAKAAIEDPSLWSMYPQQVTEVWRRFFEKQEQIFAEAMSLMEDAKAGRYVSSAPAGSHALLEKLADIDPTAAMQQMGKVPRGLLDPEYQKIIDAGRAFQDQAAATMYTMALRYADDIDAFDHVISAELDVKRMAAQAAAMRAEIAAKYADLRKPAVRKQYYKEMSEMWNDFWFSTSARYHSASMAIATDFVTKRLAPDATFVEPWADPFGRTLTLVEPVITPEGRRWRVLDMEKRAIADDLVPETQIPPEAIQAWEEIMSGARVRNEAEKLVQQVHAESAGAAPAKVTSQEMEDVQKNLQQRMDQLEQESVMVENLLRKYGEPPETAPNIRGLLPGPTADNPEQVVTAEQGDLLTRLRERLEEIEAEKRFYRELLLQYELLNAPEVDFYGGKPLVLEPRVTIATPAAQVSEKDIGERWLTRPKSLQAVYAPGDRVRIKRNGKEGVVESSSANLVKVQVMEGSKLQTRRYKPESLELIERPKPPAETPEEGMALAIGDDVLMPDGNAGKLERFEQTEDGQVALVAQTDATLRVVKATDLKPIDDIVDNVEQAAITGKRTQAWSDPAKKYEFEYQVVELDDLVVSNLPDGRINPAYPSELQPRDRSQVASRLQVEQMARNLAPEELLTETTAIDRGAPIVNERNVVESGNGRTMALGLATDEQFAVYRQMLLKRAEEFGVDPKQVEKLRRPVLVRRRLTEVEPTVFAAEANARTTLAMNMSEQSKLLAQQIHASDLQLIDMKASDTLRQALALEKNQEFVRRVLARVPPAERAALVDATGAFTTQGVDVIRSALFAKVFEDGQSVLRNFIQAPRPDLASIGAGIERAIVDLAQLPEINPDFAIGRELAQAAQMLNDAKRTGTPVKAILNQADFFGDLTPEVRTLLEFLNENARSGRKIGAMLSHYANAALLHVKQQGALFADAVPDKLTLLQAAIERVRRGDLTPLSDTTLGVVLRPNVPVELKALWAKLRKAAKTPSTRVEQPKFNFGGLRDAGPVDFFDVMQRNDRRVGRAGNLKQPTVSDAAAFRIEDIDQIRRRLLAQLDRLGNQRGALSNQQKLHVMSAVQELLPMYDNVLAGVTKGAQAISDFAMLDYSKVHGFDTALALFVPYHFWFTRSAKNWIERSLLRPSVLATYLRIKHAIDQQNERENTPQRMQGTIGVPGTEVRISNPYNLLIPYQTLYELNDLDEPTQNPNLLQRFVDTARALGFGLNPIYDSIYKIATGRSREIQAGDFIPQYRLINYVYKSLTGQELPGAGDEYDPYRDARTLARMVQAGKVDSQTALWLMDRLYQRAQGVPPLPEEAMMEKAGWDRILLEALKDSGLERLFPLATRALLGPTAYLMPETEMEIRRMQADRRKLGYSSENLYGSKAAIEAFDKQFGYEEVRQSWMAKGTLAPGATEEPPAPPTWPYRQTFTAARPGVTAVDAEKKTAKVAIQAEMDAAVNAALQQNPNMTPAELREIKKPYLEKLDALAKQYPSATDWDSVRRDFYANMNPDELLSAARKGIVYQAMRELAPMRPKAGASRQEWDAYNAALEARVAELMNDPQALSAQVYGRPIPGLATPGQAPATGVDPTAIKSDFQQSTAAIANNNEARSLIDSVINAGQTAAEQEYWRRREAQFAEREAMWSQRKKAVYAIFGDEIGRKYEEYLALPREARKAYRTKNPELRAVSLFVFYPKEYAEIEQMFGADGVLAWSKLPTDRKARALYYDAHPQAFLVQAWLYGRPGAEDEQDTTEDETFRYNFGADYEMAKDLFGADIWDVVSGYRRGWDKQKKAEYYRRHPQLSPFFEWWYGNLETSSPYENVGRAFRSSGGRNWGGWKPKPTGNDWGRMPTVYAREMDRSLDISEQAIRKWRPQDSNMIDLSWIHAGSILKPRTPEKWRRERLW